MVSFQCALSSYLDTNIKQQPQNRLSTPRSIQPEAQLHQISHIDLWNVPPCHTRVKRNITQTSDVTRAVRSRTAQCPLRTEMTNESIGEHQLQSLMWDLDIWLH